MQHDGASLVSRPLRPPPALGSLAAPAQPSAGSRAAAAGAGDGSAKQRRRRWAPKSRTGCGTCRKRRVKCDEARPHCRRCVASGVACDGFLDSPPLLQRELSDSPAPVDVVVHPRDIRVFDMLRTETVLQVAGSFDHAFWAVDVLRACRQYPAIWHGNLALAAMNKRCILGARWADDSDGGTDEDSGSGSGNSTDAERRTLRDFATRQYGLAVARMLEITRKPAAELTSADKEVVMMGAVLFTAIAVLKGDMNEAKAHAKHCSRLLHHWDVGGVEDVSAEIARQQNQGQQKIPIQQKDQQQQKDAEPPQPRSQSSSPRPEGVVLRTESLVALVTHFESQFFNNLDPGALSAWYKPTEPFRCRIRPLASVNDAYYEFIMLFGGLMSTGHYAEHTAGKRPDWAPMVGPQLGEVMHFRLEFRVWRSRLNTLRLRSFKRRPADERGLRVLELLWGGVDIALSMDTSSLVLGWDAMEARFFDLYRDIDEYLLEEEAAGRLAWASPGPSSVRRGFSFSMTPAIMLELIASKCRNNVLRRRSVERLRGLPHQEGMLEPRMTAAIVEGVVMLEEGAVLLGEPGCRCVAGRFVCENHRIIDCRIEFLDEPGVATALYLTVGDLRAETVPKAVTLRW